MRLTSNFFFCLLINFFINAFCNADTDTAKKKYHVRVLLQETHAKDFAGWKIESKNGVTIINKNDKTKTDIMQSSLTIDYKNDLLIINGRKYTQQEICMRPKEGHLKFDQKEYEGSLIITKNAEKLYLINVLYLEDYVCSVLKTECWPGWPLEINKVMAIAVRTYVIGIIIQGHCQGLPYHVRNTNKHQTYTGVHNNQTIKEAVRQTAGIFIAHNDQPIVAMYDSCCGGVIPVHIHGVNFKSAPYLARSYACNFCKTSRAYNWKADFTLMQFEELIKKEMNQCKGIKHIAIEKIDGAGLVQKVCITHKNPHKLYLTGKQLYSFFSKVRSFCFNITCAKNKIQFTGRGVGHHLGLCQWGALEMIKQGYDVRKIFNFYFPGTTLMRLEVA